MRDRSYSSRHAWSEIQRKRSKIVSLKMIPKRTIRPKSGCNAQKLSRSDSGFIVIFLFWQSWNINYKWWHFIAFWGFFMVLQNYFVLYSYDLRLIIFMKSILLTNISITSHVVALYHTIIGAKFQNDTFNKQVNKILNRFFHISGSTLQISSTCFRKMQSKQSTST